MKTKIIVAIFITITLMITMYLSYSLTQNLREEVIAVKTEHEAILKSINEIIEVMEDGKID